MTTLLSQRDPRWADLRLGLGRQTIGEAGCLLTCLSMLLHDLTDNPLTPDALNRWLIRHNRFVNNNEIALATDPVRELGLIVERVILCEDRPAPTGLIVDSLQRDAGVIVKVAFSPSNPRSGGHYVRVLQPEGDDFRIADPWQLPGFVETLLLPRYALPHWDAARAILRVAILKNGRNTD